MIIIISLFVFLVTGISWTSVILVLKFFVAGYIINTVLTTTILGYLFYSMAKNKKLPIEYFVDKVYVNGKTIHDLQWEIVDKKN